MNEQRPPSDSGPSPEPPRLTPPDEGGAKGPAPRSKSFWLVVVIGLLLLVAVIFVLLQSPASAPEPSREPLVSPPQHDSDHTSLLEKRADEEALAQVTALLNDWLTLQARAEAESLSAWGGDRFTQAQARAQECDQLYVEGRVDDARSACQQAIDDVELLLSSKDTLLDELLLEGATALTADDAAEAMRAYQRALSIDPDNLAARAGLLRAEQRPEVMRLTALGVTLEQQGDDQAARDSLNAAVELDPGYQPAREVLARVEASMVDRQYRQLMSTAIQALDRGDLATADRALRKVAGLKPRDVALKDLQMQLDRTRLSRNLAALRKEGQAHEQGEEWSQALEVCHRALKLDPHAAFAAACVERVTPRIDLDKRLQTSLANPDRLFDDAPLQQARLLLEVSRQALPRGPRLQSQSEQLAGLIRVAETRVEVLLRSDGQTDVTIYHVGRLGRFDEKKLVLRTGNYTATGSRIGFRDVRHILKVRPGQGTMTFTLRCEEPI